MLCVGHLLPCMRHNIDIQPPSACASLHNLWLPSNPQPSPRCTDDGKQTNQQRFQHQTVYCLLCGSTATQSLTHTYLWIFSKAAILCFTDHNARGDDEGGRSTLKNKRATAFPSTHCMLCRSIYCCLSLPPITAWLADRIGGGELQKRRKVENNAGIENEQP